jgi:hypothetical protein
MGSGRWKNADTLFKSNFLAYTTRQWPREKFSLDFGFVAMINL